MNTVGRDAPFNPSSARSAKDTKLTAEKENVDIVAYSRRDLYIYILLVGCELAKKKKKK